MVAWKANACGSGKMNANSTVSKSFNYPISFIHTPVVITNGNYSGAIYFITNMFTSSCTVNVLNTQSSQKDIPDVRVIAVGT